MSTDAMEPDKASMGGVVARGAAVTMLGQIIRLGIQVLGFMVLARMLDPEIFGLLAMVMVIVGFGEVVRDAGLSTAMIQATHVSQAQRSNLFWINTGVGFILAGIIIAVSGLIADFYGEPNLRNACFGLSTIFVVNGLSTQYRACLNRDLRFKALAVSDVAAMSAGFICAVGAALAGWGLWALIVQYVVQAIVILVMTVGLVRWVPNLPSRGAGMGELLSFGWTFTATQMINYLCRNVDSIVIGRRFGAESLGLYDRAYQLLTLPLNQINTPITKVVFPVLSKLKNERIKFDNLLLRAQATLTQAVAFIFSFACAFAQPLIEVALGTQWIESAAIFQLLAVSGVIQAAAFGTYWVFLARGLIRANLIYTLSTKILLVIFVVVGSGWGVLGVAAGYSLATFIAWPIGLFWISRITSAPAMKLAINSARIILAYAASATVAILLVILMPSMSPILELLAGAVAYIAVVALIATIFSVFRADLNSVWAVRKLLVRKGTNTKEFNRA